MADAAHIAAWAFAAYVGLGVVSFVVGVGFLFVVWRKIDRDMASRRRERVRL